MNAHLKIFAAESFRGLNKVNLEGLGQFNLLVGENNSGKTSLLEAICLAASPGDQRNWLKLLSMRDAGVASNTVADLVSWLFPLVDRDHAEERREIRIQASYSDGNESLRLAYTHEFETIPPDEYRSNRVREGEDEEPEIRKISHILLEYGSEAIGQKAGELIFGETPRLPGRRMIVPGLPSISDSIRRLPRRRCEVVKPHAHRSERSALGAVSRAVLERDKDFLISVLQIFDADLVDVEVVAPRSMPLLMIEHRKLGMLPLHAFGDGMRKAVVVIGRAMSAEGGLLLLDEVETALHPSIQKPFFNALAYIAKQIQIQIFAATHSLDAVDSILQSWRDPDTSVVAFHLSNTGEDRVIKRMPEDFLNRARFQRGIDIR